MEASRARDSGAASSQRGGPLSDVRVLEFGQYAAGPFSTLLLADWGADVVKIESAAGEGLRTWPPFVNGPEGPFSLNFASMSRNKRSAVFNLKDETDRKLVRELLKAAHILVENFRPGVMDRLGFGYEDVHTINPALVYCSVSGYGHEGPWGHKGAFDIAIQGMSGLMSITGEEEGPPAKCGVPVADFASATFAALACVVALREAEKTGTGSRVDVSMLSCILAMSTLQTSEFWGTGEIPTRLGSAHARNAPYQAFQGGDGNWFIVAAGNDRLWHWVCDAIEQPELKTDPRFISQPDRVKHQKALASLLGGIFKNKPANYWIDLLDTANVPVSPLLNYKEVLEHPQVIESEIVRKMRLPNGGETYTIGNPIKMSGYRYEVYQEPPLVGEHTQDVIQEWLDRRK